MRFWQKVFFSVLFIFVIAFNIGIFFVMHFTYKEQLNSVKQRAANESYFLKSSISKDFASIEETKTLTRDNKVNIYESYALYYEKQDVYIELWNGTSKIGGYFDFDIRERLDLKNSNQDIIVHRWKGKEFLFIACSLDEPYERNVLVIAYPLIELVQVRENLIKLVIGVDISITILLSIFLYVIIKQLMKPLRYLADATQSIAKGDYSKRITNIHSHDELEILAKKFNSMALKIVIKTIRKAK